VVDLRRFFGGAPQDEEPEVEEVEEREPNPLEEAVLSHVGESLSGVVGRVASEKGVKFEEAARGVFRAVEDGKVRLVDPSPPEGLLGYFASAYSLWFWLVCGFVGVVLFTIYAMPQVYPLVYLRYAVGAIYVLYVPGYTLIEALYPKADELERLERFALGVGLSLALVPLVGLVLNYTPWGIRLDPIFASLSLLTVALGAAGVYRKYIYFRLGANIRNVSVSSVRHR